MKPNTANNKEEAGKSNITKPGIISSVLGSALKNLFRTESDKDSARLWLTLEADLKQALKNEEMKLDYQPIMDSQSGKIYGMEALLRWHHRDLGVVAPVDLFAVAEATGLTSPIGEWVLEEACSQAERWNQSASYPLKLFINLSITQLRDVGFLEIIYRVLNNTKIDPTLLVLEVPQTASLEQEDIVTLEKISKDGIVLSIDDFGTANSSWKLLKSFGIIKIDNTMTQMINHYQDDSTKIMSAIFAMAKSLGIKTLAEGVETQEQYQFLRDKKCDFMQGYYFSKPLGATEFGQLLTNHKM